MQNVTSYRSSFVDARCNVKSEDHKDTSVQMVKVDTVTSSDVTCGDVTRGDVTSGQLSQRFQLIVAMGS